MAVDFLDFNSWMKYGYEKGWISDVFCNTHDGGPMTDEELQEWEFIKDEPINPNIQRCIKQILEKKQNLQYY